MDILSLMSELDGILKPIEFDGFKMSELTFIESGDSLLSGHRSGHFVSINVPIESITQRIHRVLSLKLRMRWRMRKFRTSPLNEGELDGYLVGFVITAEDASQTDLDGKRVYNSRVGA